MLDLLVRRIAKRPAYTIGRLYVGGVYLCDTLEDTDRELVQGMTAAQISAHKVYGKTAIPAGRYRVSITYSPKFRRNLPILHDVTGFEGIRIHSGNTAADSEGCLLVGENKKKGMVLNSRIALDRLMRKLNAAVSRKEEIWITIG